LVPLPNGRDLGGTPLSNGRMLAYNRLLRSASPAHASPADVDDLIHTHGIRTVIDLRSQHEAEKDAGPCLLHAASGAPALKHLPMLGEQMLRDGLKRKALRQPRLLLALLPAALLRLAPSRRLRARGGRARDRVLARLLETISLDEIYALILRSRGAELKALFETLARPGALPALVHCTHGKDRTGVAVALCLHICGASAERIAADYAASHAWGCSEQGRAAMMRLLPPHLEGRVDIESWCGAPRSAMYALLSLVERRHGSVDGYLDSIGVDAELRARCAHALTEDAEA